MKTRGLTRRRWATLVAAAPVIAGVAQSPQNVPAPSIPAPTAPAVKALEDVRKVSERLKQTEVPMATEPAFSFRAL